MSRICADQSSLDRIAHRNRVIRLAESNNARLSLHPITLSPNNLSSWAINHSPTETIILPTDIASLSLRPSKTQKAPHRLPSLRPFTTTTSILLFTAVRHQTHSISIELCQTPTLARTFRSSLIASPTTSRIIQFLPHSSPRLSPDSIHSHNNNFNLNSISLPASRSE